MSSHPAVEAAAVAMLRGWQPLPWAYADVPDEYMSYANRVLSRAAELHADEMNAVVQAVGAHVGNRVGEILAKAFS